MCPIAVDVAIENENIGRFGLKENISPVHRTRDFAGLIRAFEMPGQRVTILRKRGFLAACTERS
jgi:hypothetical protein